MRLVVRILHILTNIKRYLIYTAHAGYIQTHRRLPLGQPAVFVSDTSPMSIRTVFDKDG